MATEAGAHPRNVALPAGAARLLERRSAHSAVALLGVLVATVAQLVRQPGVHSWDSMFQEDGGIFVRDALSQPLGHDLFQYYNGYLHWGPRLIAHFATLFPLGRLALILAVTNCLVVSAVALYVYFASARVFERQWARVAMAAAIVVLPAGGFETNANIGNLHWYLMFGAFWVCVANPRRGAMLVCGALIIWFGVMSDASVIAFMPLLLIQAWRDGWRTPRAALLPAVLAVGFFLQWKYALHIAPVVPYTPSHWGEVPPIYGLRVTGSFLVGDRWLGRLWNGIGYPFVYGSIAVVLALALYAFWRRRDLESRLFVAASAAYSFGLMAASLKVRGTGNFLLHGAQFGLGGSRYTVISILPLYGIAIAAFERREPRLSPRVWRGVQVVVLAAALVVVAANFRIITTRSAGPAWHYGIAQARLKCAGKLPAYQPGPVPSVSGPIHPKASDQIAIFVSPLVLPRPPWAVFATCKQIQKKWF